MSRKADFLHSVRFLLALAAGFLCVRCNRPTTAVDPVTNKIVDLGIAAHDVAASPNGSRADTKMSVEQKRDISNGAWLCRHCAAVVDVESEKHPVGTISGWQLQAQDGRYWSAVGRCKEPNNDAKS